MHILSIFTFKVESCNVCVLCGGKVNCTFNTTNMISHLENKHPGQFSRDTEATQSNYSKPMTTVLQVLVYFGMKHGKYDTIVFIIIEPASSIKWMFTHTLGCGTVKMTAISEIKPLLLNISGQRFTTFFPQMYSTSKQVTTCVFSKWNYEK